MAIPKFKDLFTDVLSVLSDNHMHPRIELRQEVVDRLNLTESERTETMKGGGTGSAVEFTGHVSI